MLKPNSVKTVNRITYLDMARGVGVVLMVIGHLIGALVASDNKAWFSPTSHMIVSFHMPLFFILSGMVANLTRETEKSIKTVALRKIRTLLLPYVIFSIVIWLMGYHTYCTHPGEIATGILWEQIISIVTLRGLSVMWFLPTLFLAEMIFLLMQKYLGKRFGTILLAGFGIAAFALEPVVHRTGWNQGGYGMYALGCLVLVIARAIISAAFLLFGWHLFGLIEKIHSKISVMPARFGMFLGGLGITAFFCWLSFKNIKVDLNFMVFGNVALFVLCALGSSVGVIIACRFCYQERLLRFLGENSLVIMATHLDFGILGRAIWFGYIICNRTTRAKDIALFGSIGIFILVSEILIIYLFKYVFFWIIGKKNPWKKKEAHQ